MTQTSTTPLSYPANPANPTYPAPRNILLDSAEADDGISELPDRHAASANFEEWIKMATDNKINSHNSWNFALIDYFHDMSLLKDGDNINFQKASVTLDGCVKVYSSRVDSVATHTGLLISGLSYGEDSGTNSGDNAGGNSGEDTTGDGDSGEDAGTISNKLNRKRKKAESTLVKNFSIIKAKKMDKELTIDPVFKKALSEFDEGGAKSLLLNTLNVDSQFRVVFDAEEVDVAHVIDENSEVEAETGEDSGIPEKIAANGSGIISDIELPNFNISEIDYCNICPSLIQLETVAKTQGNVSALRELTEATNGENLGIFDLRNDFSTDFEPQINDLEPEVTQMLLPDEDFTPDGHLKFRDDRNIPNLSEEITTKGNAVLDTNLMAYFDEKMKKTWAGPQDWRIQNLRNKIDYPKLNGTNVKLDKTGKTGKTRKNEFVIDFLIENDPQMDLQLESDIFTTGTAINLPKNQLLPADDKHLLPFDSHFSSKQLVELFMKPGKLLSVLRNAESVSVSGTEELDEEFWAQTRETRETRENGERATGEDMSFPGDFGEDDGYDNTQADIGITDSQPITEFGNEINTKPKIPGTTGGLNYSRVAKKVDVKLLKDNLWNVLDSETTKLQRNSDRNATNLQFSDLVGHVGAQYDPKTRKDLSTSFYFICLLHLANENGLTIENTEDYSDLKVYAEDTGVPMVQV